MNAMAKQGGKRVADAFLKALRRSQVVPSKSAHNVQRVLPPSLLLVELFSSSGSSKAIVTAQHNEECSRRFREVSASNLSHQAAIAALCATAAASLSVAYAAEDVGANKRKEDVTSSLPVEFLKELKAAVGEENVVMDIDERMTHAKPWGSYHPVKGVPGAVVYPSSTEDVVAVVKACSKHLVPVTPYAAGTSLEGHTTTPHGGISINMTRMDKVIAIHESDLDCVVQPGVGWMDLNATLAPVGLFFPLDPGPGATIGGMVATRCSGSLAVKYGTMRDNVLALKVVLADGSVIVTGTRARKSAAGYDLTRLMVGSEGTLGIITEVTLRLQHVPTHSAVAMCCFPSIKDAADAAIGTVQSGVPVSRVELVDEVMMHAFNLANSYNYTERPTLMFELVGASQANVAEQVAAVQAVAQRHGGGGFLFAETEEDKKELWRARKEALWAAYSLRPGTEPLITDVCVPLSRLADCISETKAELEKVDLPAPVLAHAGDGNFHVCIFIDPNDPQQVAEAKRLSSNITMRALAMEGTCTGEHGIGVGKKEYLRKELGEEAMDAMRSIKGALDPQGVMNPGKVLPQKMPCS